MKRLHSNTEKRMSEKKITVCIWIKLRVKRTRFVEINPNNAKENPYHSIQHVNGRNLSIQHFYGENLSIQHLHGENPSIHNSETIS